MSRWGTSIQPSSVHLETGRPGPKGIPDWVRVLPFYLSAVIYCSLLFSFLSPLPILFLYFARGRKWAWLAFVANVALVYAGTFFGAKYFFKNLFETVPDFKYFSFFFVGFFSVFVGMIGLALPEFLTRKNSIEKSVVSCLVALGLGLVFIGLAYQWFFHSNLILDLFALFDQALDRVKAGTAEISMYKVEDIPILKRQLRVELFSSLFELCLTWVFINLVLLFKFNPGQLRERLGLDVGFFKRWKAPEYLVWPTIVAGFLWVFDFPIISDVALNVLKPLLAIYAIQGLSILAFLFDVCGLKGPVRIIPYVISILFMQVLILSLGFFDLWFDFRSKLRQS